MSSMMTAINVPEFIKYNTHNPCVKVYQDAYKNYTQVRYLKTEVDKGEEDDEYYAGYRSVTMDKNGTMIGYGIAKTMQMETFVAKYDNIDIGDFKVEELVEGTLIQVFYNKTTEKLQNKNLQKIILTNEENNQGWMLSSRSKIHATNIFYKTHLDVTTSEEAVDTDPVADFASMFIECAHHAKLDLSKMDQTKCYNFIVQHPKNMVVNKLKSPRLYFIQAYRFEENRPVYLDATCVMNEMKTANPDLAVYTPCVYDTSELCDVEDIMVTFKSATSHIPRKRPGTGFISMGIVIKAPDGRHMKVSNPYFTYLRELRGNQPKLEYTYYEVKQQNKITEFLAHFPEYVKDFNIYREKIECFTRHLYDTYVKTKMLKKEELKNVDKELRTHVYNLHRIYLEELRPLKQALQYRGVVQYVNKIPPSLLMYSINFKKRKHSDV